MQAQHEQENYQQALQDIVAIRRSIRSFQKTKDGQINESRFHANAKLHWATFALCSIIAAVELFTGFGITRALVEQSSEPFSRVLILGSIAIFLAVCISIMYFIVSRAAETAQDGLQAYVKRNFVYLQNLSHLSDVGIKFVVIAALLFARKPEWVAPFLFLFTADHLLQGRFFVLPIRGAQIAALACVTAAAAMFYFHDARVLWPLLGFDVLTALSIHSLLTMKRIED